MLILAAVGWGLFAAALGDAVLSRIPPGDFAPSLLFILLFIVVLSLLVLGIAVRSWSARMGTGSDEGGIMRAAVILVGVLIGLGLAQAGAIHQVMLPIGVLGVGLILIGIAVAPARRRS